MAFGKPISSKEYPKRRWSLVGWSGDGKSKFAIQMKTPNAVVDADNQIDEAVFGSGIEGIFSIAEPGKEYEMRDVDAIARILRQNMKGADVATITVDSATPIVKRIVTEIQHKEGTARVSDYKAKSEAMQILSDVITEWGTDVLWVYHYHESLDNQGKKQVNTTVTDLELIRLQKHLNAKLEIVVAPASGMRGIKVLWSRAGRSGETLWDDTGIWEGMPERIESYMYDDLTADEKEVIAESNGTWKGATDAIAWAWEMSKKNGDFYKDARHAENSYDKLKKELFAELGSELTSEIMFTQWKEHVNAKINAE